MEKLIVPPGKKTGCLPRKTRMGEPCGLFGEKVTVIPIGEWATLLPNIELRSCVRKIKDQNGFGSCATESTTQALEIVRQLEGQPWTELNPLFVYHTTSGGTDRGSSIDENLAFARDYGIAPESVWPRSKGWSAKPSAEAKAAAMEYRIMEFYDIASIAEAGTALLLGYPVVFGWQGHSCVLVQLLSTTTALYANSWGIYSGSDQGFDTINLSSINFGYGMFACRTATINTGANP